VSSIENKNIQNLKADIVILGGGGSGLTAAVAAAEAGVKNIIVLEKSSTPGGNEAISHGIFAAESPSQKRQGIQVSPDMVFQDELKQAGGRVNAKLIRNFINQSGRMLVWLEDKGLKFDHVMTLGGVEAFEGGEKAPRVFHLFEAKLDKDMAIGRKLIETLIEECRKQGIQIFYDTAASKILTDEKGNVQGVLATSQGKEIKISNTSVILATGGFGGNKDMLNKYFPGHGDIFGNSISEVTGDGLVMAEEAGANLDSEIGIILIGPHHYPWARSLNLLLRRPQVMLVNKLGERYFGSSAGGNNALSRQPDKICYALLDSALLKDMIRKREILSDAERAMGDNGTWFDEIEDAFQKENPEGKAKIADSWEEIARYMGASPEVLKASVERYNSFCDKGYDEDFLKDKKYLVPLRTPPYYAILGRQGFDSTLGGILINSNMEVLNKESRIISGLYAAGDNAGGWSSRDYTPKYPGTALAFAVYSGYTAGRNAAKYLSERKSYKT